MRINGSITGMSKTNFAGQDFSYFVFTPERLSALNAEGKTKFDLMQLTYEQALNLSK